MTKIARAVVLSVLGIVLALSGRAEAVDINNAYGYNWSPDAFEVPEGYDFISYYVNTVTPAAGREAFHLYLLGPDTTNYFEGRVGIGTPNPDTALHVAGTITGGNPAQRFYWEVKAVRGDLAPLVVERATAR
jgi:hypothetical protein